MQQMEITSLEISRSCSTIWLSWCVDISALHSVAICFRPCYCSWRWLFSTWFYAIIFQFVSNQFTLCGRSCSLFMPHCVTESSLDYWHLSTRHCAVLCVMCARKWNIYQSEVPEQWKCYGALSECKLDIGFKQRWQTRWNFLIGRIAAGRLCPCSCPTYHSTLLCFHLYAHLQCVKDVNLPFHYFNNGISMS